MSIQEFRKIESEVIEYVKEVLDSVRVKNFSHYVLLLARAGYQVENEGTDLSPYVASSRLEIYQDLTREKFLVEYLNTYFMLLNNSESVSNSYNEFELNIQMMIYAQIWESHQLLKSLKRIADIMNGKPFDWKISFEQRNKHGNILPIKKGNMIREQIVKPLQIGLPKFAEMIKKLYNSEFRNAFAHASFYISTRENSIMLLDSERYKVKKEVNLFDWERRFIESVLLSYHLLRLIRERCNNFMKDYPDIQAVDIDWPSYLEPGKILRAQISPRINSEQVEFYFKKQR